MGLEPTHYRKPITGSQLLSRWQNPLPRLKFAEWENQSDSETIPLNAPAAVLILNGSAQNGSVLT